MKKYSYTFWFLWLTAIVLMVGSTLYYSSNAGELGNPIKEIEQDVLLGNSQGKETLLFFFHPKCPCTAASITELKNIINQVDISNIDIIGIALADSTDNSWALSDNYKKFENIPSAKIINDFGGEIGRKYGAETSGITGLYDKYGNLIFWGGLTASRGHEGQSPAHEIIINHLNNQEIATGYSYTEVFGCGLADSVCLEDN